MIDITHMTSFLNEWTNTVFPPKKSSMRSVCQNVHSSTIWFVENKTDKKTCIISDQHQS